MKKYGTLVTLGLAILFGVLAVMLANRWMTGQITEEVRVERDPLPLTKVVVATENIDIGVPLSARNLAVVDWPRANLPRGAFEKVEDVEGRVAITRLLAGQPILSAELATPGSGAGLVALLPEGQRAISIRVDDVSGVAGFVLPNSFVDVIVVESRGGQEVASIILEKVRVLAIAQETQTEEGKAKVVRTVTLELNPEDATKLALKTRQGSLHLALRSPLDVMPEPVVVAEQVEAAPPPEPAEPALRVIRPPAGPKVSRVAPARPAAVAAPAPRPSGPFAVEVLRGTQRQTVTFKDAQSEELVN